MWLLSIRSPAPSEQKSEPEKKTEAADGSEAFILYNLWKTHKTQAAWDALMNERMKHKFFKGWKSLGLTEEQAEEVKAEVKRQNNKKDSAASTKRNRRWNRVKSRKFWKLVPRLAKANAKAAAAEDKKGKVHKNNVRIAFDAWKTNPTDWTF